MNMFKKWMTLLLSVVALGLSGCGGGDQPFYDTGTAPVDAVDPGAGSYTLTAAASSTSIVVGTTAQISAWLLLEGVPVVGAPVTFTVDNGRFSGSTTITATTDASGLATATLTAPLADGSGTVAVTAAGMSASVSMKYLVGPVANIILEASPTAVGISSQSTLTAAVYDQYFNPVANETMKFAVTTPASGSPIINLGGIATTNASGIASATYTSGTTTGVDDVISVAQAISPSVTATTSISVLASATTISSLTLGLSIPSTAITVGTTTVTADATVLDDTGAGVEGIAVAFQIVGTGDFGGVKYLSVITDPNGVASAPLTAPNLVGSASITAATAGKSASVGVTYIPDVPAYVTLNASPATVGVSSASTLTAALYDQFGNVAPNEQVTFSITVNNSVGAVLSNPTGIAQTDASGVATMTYTSGTTVGVSDTVRVIALNGSAPQTTVDIAVSAAATSIASLSLALSSPTTAITVGTTTVTADATVLDSLGDPVVGVPVSFQIVGSGDFGGVKSLTVVTNASGVASAPLNAPILIGSATITAATAGKSASIGVTYIPDVPDAITLTASPATVGVSSKSTLTAALYDQYGNVTPNEPVTFSITVNNSIGAVLSNPIGNAQTDASGIATMTYTSGTTVGVTDTVKVVAVNGSMPSMTAGISVSAAATTIASLDLALSSPTTAITVGTTTVTADATVLDSTGTPVAGVDVSFQIVGSGDFGGVKSLTAVTNASGVASAPLNAPILIGSATITAATAGKSASVSVTYIPDVPDYVTLTASPATVGISSDSTLTAALYDQYGNVAPNEAVTFSITANNSVGAVLSNPLGNAQTDASGVATMTYTSGTTVGGIDTVKVVALNGSLPSMTVDIAVSAAATSIASLNLALSSPTTAITVGTTTVTADATVLDSLGDPVVGVSVAFQIVGSGDFGGLKSLTLITNASGVASATLDAPQLVGSATITVASAGLSDSVTVTYIPDVPDSVVLVSGLAEVDAATDVTLAATVYDQYGNLTPYEGVLFSIASNNSGAVLTPSTGIAATDVNGVATMLYTSGVAGFTDTLRVDVTNGSAPFDTVMINVVSGAVPVPAKMMIRTSSTTISSDSSTTATITVTVLDSVNVVVPGAVVSFASDGGVLSAGTVITDANGEAQITLSAGTDPTNQTITVTASSSGISNVMLPVEVVGTTVTISASRDVLYTDGLNTSSLTIKVADASGQGVYGVAVTLSVDNGAVASLNPLSGTTGVSGEFTSTLTGTSPGTVVVTAAAAGAVGTYSFTVDTTADSLLITFPANGTTAGIGVSQTITVDIPDTVASVTLVSTIGTWDIDGNVSNVTTIANPSFGSGGAESVDRGLTATEVGTATIRATDASNTSLSDEITVVFVDETVDANSTISLQASPTTVAPSVGATLNSSLLSVAVRNGGGTGIANAMVTFSMSNTTGSGEYIDPPVAYTDSSGTATASFYSGSVSSSAEGVIVTAALDQNLTTALVSDSVPIIVNGTAGSITIGASTTVASIYSNTMYSLPMSLLVTDAGGNPVVDAAVTLNLWPEKYGMGYWFCEPEPGLWIENVVLNEDTDRDLSLDATEDDSGNGALTPVISDAGTIPSIVTTDENGVATFDLQYSKESAGFIYNAISATTLVLGTETRATKRFWLGAAESDITGCYLGESPYNAHWPTLTSWADTTLLLVSDLGTTITANLTDTTGAPMDGETIKAVFLSKGTDNYDPVALTGEAPTLTASDVTDLSGNASFTYTTGGQAGTDRIKITYTIGTVVLANYIDIVVE